MSAKSPADNSSFFPLISVVIPHLWLAGETPTDFRSFQSSSRSALPYAIDEFIILSLYDTVPLLDQEGLVLQLTFYRAQPILYYPWLVKNLTSLIKQYEVEFFNVFLLTTALMNEFS